MSTVKDEKISLGYEYRWAKVDNFVLIYNVVEEEKEVRIMAVFYGAADVVAKLTERL